MIYDKDTVLKKMFHYCSYQERSLYETSLKLKSFNLAADDNKEVLKILIDEGFVDDERFAESFMRAKMRYRKWGVNKMRLELRNKGVDNAIIDRALRDVDNDIYYDTLVDLLRSKKKDDTDVFKEKNRLMRLAMQKGYQFEMVRRAIEEVFSV